MRLALVVIALAVAAPGWPQTSSAAFEVVSVHPSPAPPPNPFGFPPLPSVRIAAGSLTSSQTSLRDLIRRAFGVFDREIIGVVGWMVDERFDVSARGPATIDTEEEHREALRALLADRFGLRSHREQREGDVYELVRSRTDGRLGEHFRLSTGDCAPPCAPTFQVDRNLMTVTFRKVTSAELSRNVIPARDRTVIDRTGLTGVYDGELTFTPDPLPGLPPLPGADSGLSLFTALPEQLGLKLEPSSGPISMLVIDAVARPNAD